MHIDISFKCIFSFRLLLAVLISLIPIVGYGQSTPTVPTCSDSTPLPRTIFVNGVWNPLPSQVRQSVDSLGRAMAINGIPAAVEPFWSPDDPGLTGKAVGVLDAAALSNYNAPALDYLSSMENAADAATAAQASVPPPPLVDIKKDFLTHQRPFIDELKNVIKAGIAKGDHFVLVAHSRGNFFVDFAMSELAAENFPGLGLVGIVGVADPDNAPGFNGGLYTTRSDDRVIGISPGHLPSTFSPAMPIGTLSLSSGHRFIEDYLDPTVIDANGTSIRDTVVNNIDAMTTKILGCNNKNTYLYTSWSGTFTVFDEKGKTDCKGVLGEWNLAVNRKGEVTGTAQDCYGTFQLTGSVSRSGVVSAGLANGGFRCPFNGSFSLNTRRASGSYRCNDGSGGAWNGATGTLVIKNLF